MNELIEQLTDRFETECHLSFDCIEEEKFKDAIQTACKAQRNACLRRYQEEFNKRIYGSNSVISILTAEIEKQDYV